MANSKKSLHVKTGDRVIVTAGKDKGKQGNITKANPAYGIQGGLIKKEAPLDSSNVMIVCPACEKATRVAHKIVDGKKVRVCKKCGESLDV